MDPQGVDDSRNPACRVRGVDAVGNREGVEDREVGEVEQRLASAEMNSDAVFGNRNRPEETVGGSGVVGVRSGRAGGSRFR
jgi:hypothetical protein